MSKIVITVDTKTKIIDMTIDGQKIENVECVYLSKYIDCYCNNEERLSMDITLSNETVGDMRKRVTLSTANSQFAKENASQKIDTYKDFGVYRESDIQELEKSAAAWLGRKI